MSIRSAIGVALLLGYALASIHYAGVWRDELTLWSHVAPRAPVKPRPWINLALAQMERQQFIAAQVSLDHAAAVLDGAQIPAGDRRAAIAAVKNNRLVLARVAGAGQLPVSNR